MSEKRMPECTDKQRWVSHLSVSREYLECVFLLTLFSHIPQHRRMPKKASQASPSCMVKVSSVCQERLFKWRNMNIIFLYINFACIHQCLPFSFPPVFQHINRFFPFCSLSLACSLFSPILIHLWFFFNFFSLPFSPPTSFFCWGGSPPSYTGVFLINVRAKSLMFGHPVYVWLW